MSGTFRNILSHLRSTFKPGVVPYLNQPSPPSYANNSNGTPAGDIHGVPWSRDASNPAVWRDSNAGTLSPNDYLPAAQDWRVSLGSNTLIIGKDATNTARRCGLYQVAVCAGDPAVAWATAPVYLQIHDGIAAPAPGAVPVFVLAAPRPPDNLIWTPGVQTPFNSNKIGSPGLTLMLSSTRDTYTATAQTGAISATWAYYEQEYE